MNWVHQTLAEFGQTLGIPDLDFGSHGVARLQMQSGAWYAVEPARRGEKDEVLVYLSLPCGFDSQRIVQRALKQIHYQHELGRWPLQIAFQGVGPEAALIVLTRMSDRSFTLQSLTDAFDFLERWANSVR